MTLKRVFLCKGILEESIRRGLYTELELTIFKAALQTAGIVWQNPASSKPQMGTPLDSILLFSYLSPSQKAGEIWG